MNDFLDDCRLAVATLDALPHPWAPLADAFAKGPVLLAAEGSSRLVPLGLARRLARAWGLPGVDGCTGRQVPAAYRGTLVALSNSGRTREVAEGLRGRSWLAVTGLDGGPLATGAQHRLAVLPRPERAVAATASVLGQALVVAEAIAAAAGRTLPRESLREALIAADAPADPAPAQRLWIVGEDDGVAEELALKAWETAGMSAAPVAAGLALHGLEEVLAPGDTVLLAGGDPADRAPIAARLVPTGAQVVDLAAPSCGGLEPLARLARGWRLLAAWSAQRGRDPARPTRARKIGNEVGS